SGLVDVFGSDAENERIRHAIACALLALKGQSQEDVSIAGEVVATVMVDEFEDKIIQELIGHSVKAGKAALKKRSAKSKSQPKKASSKADAVEPAKTPAADSKDAPGPAAAESKAPARGAAKPWPDNLARGDKGEPTHAAPATKPPGDEALGEKKV